MAIKFVIYTFFTIFTRRKNACPCVCEGFLGVFADLSAKVQKILEFLKHFRLKYLVLSVIALAVAHVVLGSATPRPLAEQVAEQVRRGDSLAPIVAPTKSDSTTQRENRTSRRSRRSRRLGDTVATPLRDTLAKPDSLAKSDSLAALPLSQRDTTARKKSGSPIEQIINGKNTDSLYYDVRNKRVYIYNQGDVKYDNMGLQADYMHTIS